MPSFRIIVTDASEPKVILINQTVDALNKEDAEAFADKLIKEARIDGTIPPIINGVESLTREVIENV